MRGREELEIPLVVNRDGDTDLRHQVAEQVRDSIRSGAFPVGQRMPSSRELAGTLGVSRATVTAALTELEGEGWVEARHGSGTYVSAALDGMGLTIAGRIASRPPSANGAAPDRNAKTINLVPGFPDTTGLADAAWRRAWREAVNGPIAASEPPLAGLLELREAIAEHVQRARGIGCNADQVLITAGTADAVRLLADAVGVAGHTALVEDPGYAAARAVLSRAGAVLHPVPVDEQGAVTSALLDAPRDARILYLTPSHQYPLGGLLPVQRRAAALSWAAQHEVVIIEDDYDGEFRFGATPVPALATLDAAGCVAYVGTLSKVLSPALRLGFVVAPKSLVALALDVRADTGMPVPGVVQSAMAGYIRNGGARRHISRQRRLYAERRSRLVRRLDALAGVVGIRGLDAGLHAVITLEPNRASADVVRRAAAKGIAVADLDDYRMSPDLAAPGIVIGYGHAPAADLDRAIDVLADVLT